MLKLILELEAVWNAKAIFLSEKLQNMYDDCSEYILLIKWLEGKE